MLQVQKSSINYRKYFSDTESENLFYDFTDDHRMDYLWDDQELLHVLHERYEVSHPDCFWVHWLVQNGFLELLRCLRCEQASAQEKKRWVKNIHQSISESGTNKNRVRAYLQSFCDAIDFYSPSDKKEIRKRDTLKTACLCFIILCIPIAFYFITQALQNPESYFPVQHKYVSTWDETPLIDVAYQYNRINSIRFYDSQGNVKTELNAINRWGKDSMTIYEPSKDASVEKYISYASGSSVPESIQVLKDGEITHTVHYTADGMISYISNNDGRIYYSPDGTNVTTWAIDGETFRYYSSHLEPLFTYSSHREDREKPEDYQIIYQDENEEVILIRDIKEGPDQSYYTIVKDSLGDGTILDSYLSFYNEGYYCVFLPSEDIFIAHPNGTKEYENGRLIKETWGPMPNYQSAFYQYIYNQDVLTSIQEYVMPFPEVSAVYGYDRLPALSNEYMLDTKGHIVEIVPHDLLACPYHLYFEYNDAEQIAKVSAYTDASPYNSSSELELKYSYSCEYREDGSLLMILVNDEKEKPYIRFFFDEQWKVTGSELIESDLP